MSQTTGPVLAIGAITMANEWLLQEKPFDWRILAGTGVAAVMFYGVEKLSPPVAVGLSYLALVTVVFVRLNPNSPAPAETFVKWWNQGKVV